MLTVYKREQITLISRRLNTTETMIKSVLDEYQEYILGKLNRGESVKFLRICWMRNSDNKEENYDTLGYVAHEIGSKLGLSKDTVLRILQTFEELITDEVRKFYVFVIRGVCKIWLCEYREGNYKLRLSKSTSLPHNISARAISSFKRRVEFCDR